MAVAALSASDLAFVQKHTLPAVASLKPRLRAAKAAYKAGAPVCTAAPAITGTVTVGQLQTCAPGTWLNAPTYAYQWRRRGVAAIAGATSATYTLVAADSKYTIECAVTATNGAGSTTTHSNAIQVP